MVGRGLLDSAATSSSCVDASGRELNQRTSVVSLRRENDLEQYVWWRFADVLLGNAAGRLKVPVRPDSCVRAIVLPEADLLTEGKVTKATAGAVCFFFRTTRLVKFLLRSPISKPCLALSFHKLGRSALHKDSRHRRRLIFASLLETFLPGG